MLFNPFVLGVSSFIQQTKTFFNIQNEFLKSAGHLLPTIQSNEMTVLRPDPRHIGEWQRHVFEAPKSSTETFVDSLDYYTFIPAPAKDGLNSKYRGLVVMLHGCEQNASVFAQGSQMNVFAQRFGFVVLYPEQSKSHHLAQCWRWFNLASNAGMAEANTISELIAQTIKKHDIHPDRVFVAGMSAGAGMATVLAFSFPEKIAAVALHSGPVFGHANNMVSGLEVMSRFTATNDEDLIASLRTFAKPKLHDIPTLIIHGVMDRRVNISNAAALTKQALFLNDLALDTEALISRHETDTQNAYTQKVYCCKDKPVIKVLEVDNMAHDWAGGDTSLPFNGEYGPNSSEMILRFFYHHATPSNELK
ncbi:MAG: PHB depolymerase family esterase [Alcaligenaceae bacterium]|nr:PHB depolymerase family esterase [Alcaligenaceae bacterium]